MPSERWREQQELIYTVGFYGGGALLIPLGVIALFGRYLARPLLLSAWALFAVFGLLLFGYLAVLIFVNARQGVRETRDRRAGLLAVETDRTAGAGEAPDIPAATEADERRRFWTQRRLLAACAILGIVGSLMRIVGWWSS